MMERYFTLDEANDLVPWLRETFEALAPLQERAQRLHDEIAPLLSRILGNGGGGAGEQLDRKRREYEQTGRAINQQIDAIQEQGIIVRNVETGLVDFPSTREGREVYLCWIMEEPEIGFWHEVDAGFAARQPL